VRPADDGVLASCGPRGSPTKSEGRRKRRRRQRTQYTGSASPNSPANVKGTGCAGGDMASAGVPVAEGRTRGKMRGVRAPALPRSPVGAPSFAAASTGRPRPSPCVTAAGGACGPGADGGRAPAGDVMRSGLSSPPPPPRPEPKRKKEPRPPLRAAAASEEQGEGIRRRGASIPAGVRLDTCRDVTVEKLFSAVSLLRECGLGNVILGLI